MRPFLLTLGLIAALPFAATEASATSHDCNQLRATVATAVPGPVRSLPYYALDCGLISEIHLLTVTYQSDYGQQERRIRAVFRRVGLIR